MTGDQSLLTIRVHWRGHATDDLPRAVRSNPCVCYPQFIGPNFGACGVRPGCINSIVIDCDIVRYLNRKLLDRVGMKGNALGDIRSDPVGDVILSHWHGADKWPAEKILVPKGANTPQGRWLSRIPSMPFPIARPAPRPCLNLGQNQLPRALQQMGWPSAYPISIHYV